MKRHLAALLTALLLLTAAAAETRWTSVPDAVRPGEIVRYSFLSEEGEASVELIDSSGQTAAVVRSSIKAKNGANSFLWDGQAAGLTPDIYTLRLTAAGETDEVALRLTGSKPEIVRVDADETWSSGWTITASVNASGSLTAIASMNGETAQIASVKANAGLNTLSWESPAFPGGSCSITLRFTDDSGTEADAAEITVQLPGESLLKAHDLNVQHPDDRASMTCSHTDCVWSLQMGSADEGAVWRALTSPITVLKGDQRKQYKARSLPDKNCTSYTGEITYESQGVHVLKEENGWTLVGSYSSSVEGSQVGVFAEYFEGWVETKLLETRQVSQKYGIVIDKLKQRLYVYKDGRLFSTLLCSTGYAQKDKAFQETPAGEFLTISWSGGFWSGSLWCDLGIRINDGILLHEVPILVKKDSDGNEIRDTERCENYLGDRASHGCIRIQRRKTPEGVSMKWLWDNLEREKTRVIVWDDKGRELSYPSDALPLYYNTRNGRLYHSSATCMEVNEKYWPLSSFTYGQLNEKPYSKLSPCPACAPEPTHTVVDKLNKDARK